MLIDAHVFAESLKGSAKEISMNRKSETKFLKSVLMDGKYFAVDMTLVLSITGNAIYMPLGHNPMREFRPHE